MSLRQTTRREPGSRYSKNYDADYIKNSLNPLDFYRHELPDAPLKRQRWNNGGLCPFHADTKAGSFHINLSTDAFKCFSCGEAGSDVISFTMALYGLKFADALHKLADEWGLV